MTESSARRASRPVVIVVFDEVQSLDLTGPLEVFTGAERYRDGHRLDAARLRRHGRRAVGGPGADARVVWSIVPDAGIDAVVGSGRHARRGRRRRRQRRHGRWPLRGPDRGAGRRRPPGDVGVQRRLPAGRGRAARRPSSDHALGAVPGAGRALSRRCTSMPIPSSPDDGNVLHLSRRHRRHGPGPGPGRRRPRSPRRARPSPATWSCSCSGRAARPSSAPSWPPNWPTATRSGSLQEWIADHPDADCSVESLARGSTMSPRHLARVFAESVGTTPARYVEQVRLEVARRRLEESGDSVERVAAACGFGTTETMRRVFIRHLGVAPAHYRSRFRPAVACGHRATRPLDPVRSATWSASPPQPTEIHHGHRHPVVRPLHRPRRRRPLRDAEPDARRHGHLRRRRARPASHRRRQPRPDGRRRASTTITEPDIVVVPGGPGTRSCRWATSRPSSGCARSHEHTRWTTSVCTGSLILAAAGLLDGKRATTPLAGARGPRRHGREASNDRVVIDGKYRHRAPACRPASTWASPWRRGSPATRWPRPSSSASSTTRSRRSTPDRPTRHRPAIVDAAAGTQPLPRRVLTRRGRNLGPSAAPYAGRP